MTITNISSNEAQTPDQQPTPEFRRISVTLDPAEAQYVRQRCQHFNIGPTRPIKTLLGIDIRLGLMRKEVSDRLKTPTAPISVAEK